MKKKNINGVRRKINGCWEETIDPDKRAITTIDPDKRTIENPNRNRDEEKMMKHKRNTMKDEEVELAI